MVKQAQHMIQNEELGEIRKISKKVTGYFPVWRFNNKLGYG